MTWPRRVTTAEVRWLGLLAWVPHGLHPVHILRKVILRVGTKMDWLILKLH